MPMRAPRICGCGAKVQPGVLCACQQRRRTEAEKARPSARERGYDGKWDKASKAFLARPENQLCACGCGAKAEVVDHKTAHKGDKSLFWNRRNWQPMARRCNSKKAALSEGAFGHPRREAGR